MLQFLLLFRFGSLQFQKGLHWKSYTSKTEPRDVNLYTAAVGDKLDALLTSVNYFR